jgi:hypothetical protein
LLVCPAFRVSCGPGGGGPPAELGFVRRAGRMAVGDALRRLCDEVGWSYAVFWKAIGAADPV